jgi:ubiquitin fusion degradation protein 1
MHVQYPMMFRLTNPSRGRKTHCGVLEFSAEEGRVYIPHWMMANLVLQEGQMLEVRAAQLPKGKFVKFRPLSSDFLDISNPKAVLEKQFRSYSAMTKGDTLCFKYLGKNFFLDVLELKPADAVSIIETDMVVDFAPPADYVEPARAGSGSGGSGGAAAASSSSAGGGKAAGLGTRDAPLRFDDDDDVTMAGSGGAAGGSGSAGADARAAAAAAALGRSANNGGAGAAGPAAAGSPIPAAPKVVPFAGTGYRLSGGPSSLGAAAGGASESKGSPMLVGGRSPALGASPAAGGMVLSGGSGGPSSMSLGGSALGGAGGGGGAGRGRTLNKFEARRAAQAFQGEGKSLRQ